MTTVTAIDRHAPQTQAQRRPRAGRAFGACALGLVVGATAAEIVAFDEMAHETRVALSIVAFSAFGLLFLPAVRASALTLRRVTLAALVLAAVAVVMPPRGSHDIWSYASYGRMVSVHDVSAYTHVPADFPHDRLLPLVATGWRHTASVYGPGFIAISAAGTAVVGSTPTANRLFFQLMALAALAIAGSMVWRRTRDPAALAFVALNPTLVMAVNGGHNDLVVGLALLAGVVNMVAERPVGAGAAFAAGALVKLVLLVPVGALVLWCWRSRSRATAVWTALVAASAIAAGYAVAGGGEALGPLLHAGKQHSRSSVWQIVTQWLAAPLQLPRSSQFKILGSAAVVVTFSAVVFLVLRSTRTAAPNRLPPLQAGALVGGAATLVFLLAGAYVLPWYSAWGLPLLAFVWRSRVATVALVQSALIGVAYAAPLVLGPVFGTYGESIVPVLLAGGLGYLGWSAWRDRLDVPVRTRTFDR